MKSEQPAKKDLSRLSTYAELTSRIRELSSPLLTDLSDAEDYRVALLENFKQIGAYSQTNNEILNEDYYPLLKEDVLLSEETIASMHEFAQAMLNPYTLENLDLPIMYLQAKKLLADAKTKGETAGIIRALDDYIMAAYGMANITARMAPLFEISRSYIEEGLRAAQEIMEYLEPQRFSALPDDTSKEIVLVNSRYCAVFFGTPGIEDSREIRERNLGYLKRSLSFCDDPFYRENAPNYDWDYHKFRSLEYISRQSQGNNERKYDADELLFIREKTQEYAAFEAANKERFGQFTSELLLSFQLARDDYLTGRIPLEEFKKKLRSFMESPIDDEKEEETIQQRFIIPVDYIMVLDPKHLTQDEQAYLDGFYRRLVVDIYRLKKESMSFMLSYVADVLDRFIEVPGGMRFEEMALSLMVALHPPTFVHTLSVADFTVCLTRHLVEKMPERFIGFMGLSSAEEVRGKKDEILDFAKHAALLHDVGKLFIIETIIMYGRTLLDSEFEMIKAHPVIGAYHLSRHESTKPYTGVAMGHHKWHNAHGGYPMDNDAGNISEQVILDIVTVADCLDAATDSVGRSYKKGKTLDDFIGELHEGSGTHYASYLDELLHMPDVYADMSSLLVGCRDENYRKAFDRLVELEQ